MVLEWFRNSLHTVYPVIACTQGTVPSALLAGRVIGRRIMGVGGVTGIRELKLPAGGSVTEAVSFSQRHCPKKEMENNKLDLFLLSNFDSASSSFLWQIQLEGS